MYTNLSKNHAIPSVNGGILWEDSVNKRLYLYGGEYYETPPSDDFILYSYDILYDEWVQHGPPKGAGIIDVVSSYGAGISIPSRGEAYYYGGWLSNKSVPDWKGLPRATNRLIKYMMDSNSWSNLRRRNGLPSHGRCWDVGLFRWHQRLVWEWDPDAAALGSDLPIRRRERNMVHPNDLRPHPQDQTAFLRRRNLGTGRLKL